jgi:hypothetical protein
MNKLTYVFTWMTGDQWHCKTAENGQRYLYGDAVSLQLGETDRWFTVFNRSQIGNVVVLYIVAMCDEDVGHTRLMTNAVAEFLLHLQEANEAVQQAHGKCLK